MIEADFLSGLSRFNLAVRKRVTSKYTGTRSSLFKGQGSTVKDYRIYAPGDDFRLIDWKIYARTDELHIKQFDEERNLTIHVILDSSASMNYGKPSKFDYGAMLGVGFAYLALKDNERFQFATYAENLEVFQPKRGMKHLATMVDYLNQRKINGDTKFNLSMKKYKKYLGTRAMIVVISDFLYDLEEIREGLLMLGHNDIKLVQVLDSTERHLDIRGDVKLRDMESDRVLKTYVSRRMKMNYEDRLDHHAAHIDRLCQSLGAEFYQVDSSMPIFDSFFEILQS